MYEIDGVEYTQNDVDYNAKLQGLTSEEWLKQNGFTASEGKTNGSTETPPTEPVKNTAAGDSSSADISLESLENREDVVSIDASPLAKAKSAIKNIKLTEEEIANIESDINEDDIKIFLAGQNNQDINAATAEQIEAEKTKRFNLAKQQKLSAKLEPVMKDFEGESLNFLEEGVKGLRLAAVWASKNSSSTAIKALSGIAAGALTTDAEKAMIAGKAEIKEEYKEKQTKAVAAHNEAIKSLNTYSGIVDAADIELAEIELLYKENPASFTEQDNIEYKELVETRNSALGIAKEKWESLDTYVKEAKTASEVIDMVSRTYDQREVAMNRMEGATLRFVAGLGTVLNELTPAQLSKRITGSEYTPMYMLGVNNNLDKWTDDLYSEVESIENRTRKKQEALKIGESGNKAGDLLDFAVDLFSEQAINTAVTSTIPGGGLFLVAGSAAGQKFNEMDMQIANGKDISAAQFYGAGIMHGLGEYITEKVTLSQVKGAFGATKKLFDLSDAASLTNVIPTVGKAFSKYALGTASESVAEGTSQLIGNLADKYILGEDIALTQGLSESLISGAFMSGVAFSAPALAVDLTKAFTLGPEMKAATARSKEMINLKNRLDTLNKDLSNNPETEAAKSEIQRRIDELAMENVEAINIAAARIEELSSQDKRALLDISSKAYKFRGAIDKINSNPKLTDKEKVSLASRYSNGLNILNNQRDQILGNSENSAAKAKAKIFQMATAAEKGLNFTTVNEATTKESIDKAIELVDNSNLSEENKFELKEKINKAREVEGVEGFHVGAEYGLPIVLTSKQGAESNPSVIAHEVSHATLFKKLIEGDTDVIGLAQDLASYLIKNHGSLAARKLNGVLNTYTKEKGFTDTEIAEEIFAATVELTRRVDLDISKNQTLQGKLMSRWNKLFPNNKEVTEVKNGKDVLDAIISFNSSFDKGELTGLSKKIIKGEVKAIKKKAEDLIDKVQEKQGSKFSLNENAEFKSSNKADLFTITVNSFNEAADLYDLNIKLNEDGTPAFTKAEWDNVPDDTKLVIGFMLGDTWKPYVKYLMGSRRDVPGFDEFANQIVDRTSTGIEKGDDGIPFLVKTYNPEGGAKLSSYIFGQVGRRLQGVINKQDGFGEITVDAVSDKPGAKELVQEETTAAVEETPKYKNLIRRGIVNPITLGNIKSKIRPIIRVLKTPMNAPVSNNVTVKPWVNELRLQLGKQVDLIIKQEMGGVKGGELRRFLLKNKTAILENMTTSYLTKAMPFAVQKSVGGVYTSNWQGQKIDRETTTTQKAGRTSGNELVRRLPKAALRISDAEFLAAVVGPGGNPIRGRKEALAKAIGEELSLDIITEELKDPNSEISEALKQNQEMLGVEDNDNIAIEAARDFERGTIKYAIKPTTSNEVSDVSLSNSNIPKSQETDAQREKHEEELFDWTGKNLGRILKKYTKQELFTLNTKEGQIEFLKAFEELGKILPKRFFRKGNSGMGSLTKTVKNLGATIKTDSPLHKHWKKEVEITFKRMSKTGFAKPVPGVTWTITPWRNLASTISDFIKNKSKIESLNKTNARHHKIMFTEFYELIKANPNNPLIPAAIAQYLQLATNDSTHYHRIGFALVGVEEGFIAGKNKGTFEHALNSHSTSIVLFEAMMLAADPNSKIDFDQAYESIMMQAKVIGLTDTTDKKLVGPFKDGMGPNFTLEKGWPVRYEDAGIALDKILLISGQNLAQARMTPDGLKFSLSIKPDAAEDQEKFREEDIENNTIDYSVSEVNDLNSGINQMIERATGISTEQTFADIDARMKGKNIGKYKFFAPGADDFRGLTSYTFAGKGKQGEADQKFFEDNLVKPYQRGISSITRAKQTVKNDFAFVVKSFPKQAKMMSEKVPGTEYTYDQALRVYLWQRQGMEVPGIKPETVRNLSRAISENLGLIEFANATLLASKQGEWMAPNKFWATETVLSGLYNMTENLGRKVYLAEFIENADIIFSPENLNKMEALYGSKYRSALEDSLYRMKNGTNRNSGSDATTNRWNNWVNQSTGAIMFFNRRSAVLQTLSIANFTNWSDNNPVKQAMAFANQKQYWADFAMIFNSPKLKERRSGLKNDVNASEIASAVKGETNKAAAALNKILELGFKPTQIADSFAIASGGAAFYRNRVNTYLKQDMSLEAAEKLAFEEFSSNADESQQSSDPMLVAQQQASVLGRLVLAFQNTPMQYTRLMKKAGQDIINGRGDFKTNMSKILYYGAVQNLIFSTLQSALFAFIPGFMDDEDDDKRDQKLETKQTRILNSMIDSLLKGSGLTGAVLATVKNSVLELNKQMDKGFLGDPMYVALQVLGISPPIGSKMRKLYSAYQTYRFEKDALQRGASIVADGRLNFSPWYSIAGNVASATFSVPGDRVIDEITSISEALDSRNTQWQRLALAMGWKTWDVGAKNEEHDLLKVAGKKNRKAEGKVKAAKTRAANKKSKPRNTRNTTARNQPSRSNIRK